MSGPVRTARGHAASWVAILMVLGLTALGCPAARAADEPAPPAPAPGAEEPAPPAARPPLQVEESPEEQAEEKAATLEPRFPRELGEVRMLGEPRDCDGQECLQIAVKCPNLAGVMRADLKIGPPKAKKKVRGTILFTTGLGGKGLWEEFGSSAQSALRKLRSAGFRTVQLTWEHGWIYAPEGKREGQSALACNPASVANWLIERFASDGEEAAFCTTGNSAGSSLSAYLLSDYGLADRIDAAVLTGGPVFSRLDWGCGLGGPSHEEFTWNATRRRTIDGGFGYTREGGGPCQREDPGFQARLISESHLGPGRPLSFPHTSVWVLVGDQDDIGAVPQARIYALALEAAGSPDVHFETLKKTPHGVPSVSRGAKRVRNILLDECKPR